jgi:uncharacterized protein YndB with AHSA1/START domain
MSKRSVVHATFVVERLYDAKPERVFVAWASAEAKGHWFGGPDEWQRSDHELDFRVGGREHSYGGPPGGPLHKYDGVYKDIVPDKRIVLAFDMHLDATLITVSTATVEFRPDGAATRLIYTEQIVFLDGADNLAQRREGTEAMLDNLESELRRANAH